MDAALDVIVVTSVTIEVDSSPISKQVKTAADDLSAKVSWPKWVRPGYVNTIRNLRCFENVRSMIINYMPLPEVARQIHSLGELREISAESLRQYLEHYKATIPPAMIVRQIRPNLFEQSVRKLDSEINTINDMNKLKSMMFQRLEMILEREKAMGFPLPQAEKQYQIAMEIVSRLDEMMQQRMGASSTQDAATLKLPNVDLDQLYNRKGLNDAVKDPASRLRVMKFMENIINYYGKKPNDETGGDQ